jgi:hypothetical protein
MDELKIYYSSGNNYTNEYSGETQKSIGGIITNTEVPNGLRNLFGTISLRMVAQGVSDYRAVYLRNTGIAPDDITLLRWYVDVPILAPTNDPSTLTPNVGDMYIVPPDSIGLWLGEDGKKAVWGGVEWTFSFSPFATYEFGFQTPVDIDIDINPILITEGFVPTLENPFQAPRGVSFISANTLANETTIGTGGLIVGQNLVMWIKRTVFEYPLNTDDLVIDKGSLFLEEDIPIIFNYDTP